jgi:RNA polymerase sigma-54 factor
LLREANQVPVVVVDLRATLLDFPGHRAVCSAKRWLEELCHQPREPLPPENPRDRSRVKWPHLSQLDPRPGQIFAEAPQNYVLPDVTVEKIQGQYQVILNGEQIPHLRISNTYKDIMSQDGSNGEVKDYIRDKIRSGKFLIKSIHQRQQTISNIAHQIVSRQKEFLEQGSAHLKPMTMVQIADAVGVHETTVSRAISGKYISTPQGVFEMKYFFTPGYQTSSGVSMSNTSVKEAILDLVKNEAGSAPLSDKEIVEILGQRGIPIARRTVAKYRTELNILPSNMRRKY